MKISRNKWKIKFTSFNFDTLPKYTTNVTNRGAVYKLKSKVVLTFIFYISKECKLLFKLPRAHY